MRHVPPVTRSALALWMACGVGACASAPPPPAPAPAVLAYQPAAGAAPSYTFADTASYAIDAGAMGTTRVSASLVGSADIAFDTAAAGLEAVIHFPRLRGVFENPGQGSATRVSEADVAGGFRVALTPRGGVTVLDTPSISEAFRRIAGPETLPRLFFTPLPARPVAVGDVWVDTVVTSETSAGTRSRLWREVTTTLMGDTVADGLRLLRLTTHTRVRLEVTGEAGGVDIRERLVGILAGEVLWDERGSRLHRKTERGRLEGMLEIRAGSARPLPVTARIRRLVELAR